MTKSKPCPERSRRVGAPRKNKNALKHGIYSHFIVLADAAAMNGMSDKSPAHELSMARVLFAKAMKERAATNDAKQRLGWDFACHYWLQLIIDTKLRIKETEQTAVTVWDTFIEAIRAANDRQGVK
jgi:hypothetical protein